ncbi:BnaC04g24110D [Brassica napus]|uniref:BnaC04g24110D protein n=1 Tax=Brassica napus TaxID=3708 RepID=A0A078H2F3_BRANA|nr:BnaC04g24110D [Brassica napus]
MQPCTKAPTALTLYNLKNLNLKNLRVRNAQQIQISIEKCNNVYVKNVEITVLGDSPNTDGIHITNTQNIRISNSDIGTGDDCISIEDGSQNVQISDLTCGPGHGISIGSLGDDNSKAYVSGINVDGAKLSETDNGVRIKTYQSLRRAMGSIDVTVFYGEDPERWVEWIDEFVGAHNFTVFKTRQLAYGFIEGDAMSCTLVKQEKEQLEQPSLMDSLKEMSQLLNRFEQSWKGKEDTKKSQEEKTFESDDTKQVESLDGGDDLIMYSNQLIRYVKSYTLILEYPVMVHEKDNSETKTPLFEEDNGSKTDMDRGAYQVFEKILKRKKKIIKKKRRLKRLFSNIKNRLVEILNHKESDNSDMLGIQTESTTKRQRKSWLEWSKVSCHCAHTREKLDRKWVLMFREKKMCDEFVKLWVDQKELADLHAKIPTMNMHEINRITAQIYIGRGRILVNCETRFAKVTVEGKDRYRVTMDVHRKVLLERSRFFMEKMKTVVLMYYDDLKKKLVGENVIKRLALLKVSAAVSFDEGVMSCLEHLKAAPWSEDKVDIVLACLDELHLPEDSVSMILHRVSFELKRSKTDDIF